MSFNEWQEYNHNRNKSKGQVGRNGADQQTQRLNASSSRKVPSKVYIKKRKENIKKASAVALIAFVVAGVLVWSTVSPNKSSSNLPPDSSLESTTGDSYTSKNPFDSTQGEGTGEVSKKYTYDELKDFKNFCYVDNYGNEDYLYATEEYLRNAFQVAKEKINKLYADNGKYSPIDGESFITEYITEERVMSMFYNESSWRVCHKDGYPLLYKGERFETEEEEWGRAGGLGQQKKVFVETADEYSRRLGGDGYTIDDRYNPVTAFEMAILNLNRIYLAYLAPGNQTHKALCSNMYDSEGNYIGNQNEEQKKENDYVTSAALYMGYRQGEGTMSRAAKTDNLRERILDSEDNTYSGLPYFRSLEARVDEIVEAGDYRERD